MMANVPRRQKICVGVLISIFLVFMLFMCGYGTKLALGYIDLYITNMIYTPYHGHFNWTEIVDEWESNELAVGTMESYLRETDNLRIYTDEMSIYDKKDIVSYIEKSRLELQMPSGITIPGPLTMDLLQLHKAWPIEVIVRDTDASNAHYEESPCVIIVYKVQDEEGKIEYLHVICEDSYGLSRFYIENESIFEYGTDESGQAIWKRSNENYEDWRLKEYSFTTVFE